MPPENCQNYILSFPPRHALHKGKQDEELNFKQLLFLRAEDEGVLQKWI